MSALRISGFLLFLVTLTLPDNAFAQNFQVVGNQTGLATVTRAELISIFKPKNNRWENNKPVVIVLPGAASVIRDDVAQQIYSNSFVAVQKYWLSLVFQGRFNAPYFFNSDDETLNFIRKTPGSIGFVSVSTGVPEDLLIKLK